MRGVSRGQSVGPCAAQEWTGLWRELVQTPVLVFLDPKEFSESQGASELAFYVSHPVSDVTEPAPALHQRSKPGTLGGTQRTGVYRIEAPAAVTSGARVLGIRPRFPPVFPFPAGVLSLPCTEGLVSLCPPVFAVVPLRLSDSGPEGLRPAAEPLVPFGSCPQGRATRCLPSSQTHAAPSLRGRPGPGFGRGAGASASASCSPRSDVDSCHALRHVPVAASSPVSHPSCGNLGSSPPPRPRRGPRCITVRLRPLTALQDSAAGGLGLGLGLISTPRSSRASVTPGSHPALSRPGVRCVLSSPRPPQFCGPRSPVPTSATRSDFAPGPRHLQANHAAA